MADDEQVRVWDASNKEITGEVEPWEDWDKVKSKKGFPGGLISFLQTSSDHEGCGFNQPTIVQAYAWPVLQSGKDLVGVAKTGSGKTLAFLLPAFVKIRKLKKAGTIDTSRGPGFLCMTPTRELCFQIYSDADKFGTPVNITAACCYGGAPRKDQLWAINQGPDLLIATPGRLNDFIDKEELWLDQVRYVVLDEADRMLDMGFGEDIKKILTKVPWDERQTCMFTATWPEECKKTVGRVYQGSHTNSNWIRKHHHQQEHHAAYQDDWRRE
jgi:superfamily II DNA/RNA helicase